MRILKKILGLTKTNNIYFFRDYYYVRQLKMYKDLEMYLDLINYRHKKLFKTERDIAFSDSKLFKKNEIKYLKSKYGKPDNTLTNKFLFGKIKILFYQVYFANQKVRMELHFFQNSLFMYSYKFLHLDKKSDKNKILNILKEKYGIESGEDISIKFCIMDKNMSLIIPSDNFNLTINYILKTNSDLFHKMHDYSKKEKERHEQLINLKKRELYRRL